MSSKLLSSAVLLTLACLGRAGEPAAATAATTNTPRLFPIFPRAQVPLLNAAPQVDGKLDPEEWKNAAKLSPFKPNCGGPNDKGPKTEGFIASTREALYLALRCHEKDLEGLIGKPTGYSWTDDGIEIFLQPGNRTGDPYLQFQVNHAGALNVGYARAEVRDPGGFKAAAGREEAAFIIEAVFPFAQLKLPAEKNLLAGPWRFNILRQRQLHKGDKKPGGALKLTKAGDLYNEESAWSPTESESAHMPHMFGYLWLEAFGGKQP